MLHPSCQRVICDTLLRTGASAWWIKNKSRRGAKSKRACWVELEKANIYPIFIIARNHIHIKKLDLTETLPCVSV